MLFSSGSLKYRFDFLKLRYVGVALSLALLTIGVVGYFVKGGFVYHIDFTGGAELRIEFKKKICFSEGDLIIVAVVASPEFRGSGSQDKGDYRDQKNGQDMHMSFHCMALISCVFHF